MGWGKGEGSMFLTELVARFGMTRIGAGGENLESRSAQRGSRRAWRIPTGTVVASRNSRANRPRLHGPFASRKDEEQVGIWTGVRSLPGLDGAKWARAGVNLGYLV